MPEPLNEPHAGPRRLYMDNAATSLPKPREVMEAMTRYVNELGASAGRGAYREAVETGAMIHECRRRICKLFNGEKPEHVVFTLNCSDALNLALRGLRYRPSFIRTPTRSVRPSWGMTSWRCASDAGSA